jgi:CheY-like chemotaxis protein
MQEDKHTFLIIDDDRNFRKILSIRLRSAYKNCTIHEAEDLQTAHTLLKDSAKYDLILLDQHLPDGTGSEFLQTPSPADIPVLSMSSDDAPEIPATTLIRGARFFLPKKNVSDSFFLPLLDSLIQRAKIEKKIQESERSAHILESVKTLLRTLQHEINNPLGALLGAIYVLRSDTALNKDGLDALKIIDNSTMRIKKVLDALSETAELEVVNKATEALFSNTGRQIME